MPLLGGKRPFHYKQTPPCRFDAVLMQALEGAQPEWLKDAFAA